LLVAAFYASITQMDDYEPLSCQNTAYHKMMERLELALSPQTLLRHLIELIISGERHVTVNAIVLELVQRELRGEAPQNFRDWAHELKPSLAKKEIQVTADILSKAWNLVLMLQYRELPAGQAKSKHVCDSSVYWLAVQEIYYQLVSPLFKLGCAQFKASRELIENTFHCLNALQNFFHLKITHERLIREQSISKLTHRPLAEDASQTEASF
jgi:hypothetical protein